MIYAPAPLNVWQIATFAMLLLTAIGLWIAPRFWAGCLIMATLFGYVAGVLQGVAVLWIALAVVVCRIDRDVSLRDAGMQRLLSGMGVVAMTLPLGMHALPGFNNPMVMDRIKFSADAELFTLYLNFDKTLAGILLLGLCCPDGPSLRKWLDTLRPGAVLLIACNVVLLIAASYILGYVRFDPKWTPLFWLWGVVNLFSVCLSEEAFFRGFVQQRLQLALRHRQFGDAYSLAVSALLFGFVHFAGGWKYVLLASLAGLGYGYVFLRTRRIEWSMLAHFSLNSAHFFLFTYPRLA